MSHTDEVRRRVAPDEMSIDALRAFEVTVKEARVLLLRECSFEQNNAQHWVADELEPGAAIDEGLKRDVLGARRKILFVEGKEEKSLDKPLYGCLFPSVSVIPKSGCVAVEQAVKGLRAGEGLHRLEVYGIVDGDGEDTEKL